MKHKSTNELFEQLLKRDQRAIAHAITLCENNRPGADELLELLFSRTGKAMVIGITGPPGSGKSTLVDQLALEWRKRSKQVAIIAVDPSSPFSGGAVLGDRIRMSSVSDDDNIYLRSLAARGALGGLSRATHNTVHILDAVGYDVILIETVGVGQAEVEIVNMADTCLVVVVPGLGDSVQAVKAGVLEIADLFVVNKYDRDGAPEVHRDIRNLLGLVTYKEDQWQPVIFDTIATQGKGVSELVDGVLLHQDWLSTSGAKNIKRLEIMRTAITKEAEEQIKSRLLTSKAIDTLAKACLERKLTPQKAALQLIDKL